MAAKTSRGYGAVHWNGRLRLAHRVSLELAYGEAPRAELQSCHRCDTPLCVRPSHLFLGTGADNAADMTAKGRSRIGERNGKAKLDADDVTAIRRRFAEGESKAEVARVYGVTRENIHAIVTGQTWRHIREAS